MRNILASDEVLRSEARLLRAQEAAGVGTFTVDLRSNRLSGTPEFFRIFGLAPCDSLSAEVFESLVLPEDTAIRSAAATRGAEAAQLRVEYRIHRAGDGALRWIARNAEFERDAEGQVARMVGMVQDITERKATQAALDESAEQFRTLAQALPNHVWTATPDGLLDWFNERVYQYSGAPAGTLYGQGWARIVHPDDLASAAERWRASVASGELYETEFRICRADGNYRWHLVRAVPVLAAAGTVARWFGTNTDIHERKLAEAQSARDRDRIWTLSQELMLVCDFQGTVLATNPATTRILGWSQDEMAGRSLADFLHPDDLAYTKDELQRLASGATTLSFENRYRAKDGAFRQLSWAAVPDGERIHGVARDVTRERAAEDALRQSQKMEAVGQLTGGVAHDFNNLLTIIRTSIDLMRRPNLAEERRLRFMESISAAVSRAAKLTGQLLAFARRQALQPAAFDATQNVRSMADMLGTLVGSRISVDLIAAEQPCIVLADPSQFDTAIVNMAVNARDAMEGAGRLTLRIYGVPAIPAVRSHAALPGAFVAVALSDTGAGIEPDQIEKIFEPFFTTKPVGLGTGLGLSQVFGFAKQSGGDIQVESVPGQGSTFTLYLPRAAQDGPLLQAGEAAGSLGDGKGACILIVEDNVDVAVSVDETLRELGYTTVVAHSADAALAQLAQGAGAPQRFAAVFSDVVMAGMDGIQLAQEIRRRYGSLPVVLSSGYSEVLAKDSAHGFDLLPKPYSLDALSCVLRDAIAKRAGRPAAHGDKEAGRADRRDDRERARQDELDLLLVLDSEEEAAFDELTRLAASLFDTPIALVSLIDRDRQWFKSHHGLAARETPREYAFCAHAIRKPGEVMVVNDAAADPRFVDNPLVTGDPNIRFYAGAPLVSSGGHALGTICVIDYRTREIDPRQLEVLRLLATQVVHKLEQRRRELAGKSGT